MDEKDKKGIRIMKGTKEDFSLWIDKKKIEATEKQSLSFKIENQDSGTGFRDRVKIFVNGEDILKFGGYWIDDHIGLLPEKMLQTNLLQTGKCLVGVCCCSDEGCDPYYVDISIREDMVIWNDPQTECQYKFDKTEYSLAIKQLQEMIMDYFSTKYSLPKKELQNMLADYVSNTSCKPTEEDLENFKKEVYTYLTQHLGASTMTAEGLMLEYETNFESYLARNWKVSTVAMTMWYF